MLNTLNPYPFPSPRTCQYHKSLYKKICNTAQTFSTKRSAGKRSLQGLVLYVRFRFWQALPRNVDR